MLLSSDRLEGKAIGVAAFKNFRFAKYDKDALVWCTGRTNRLRVSELASVRLLFVKL